MISSQIFPNISYVAQQHVLPQSSDYEKRWTKPWSPDKSVFQSLRGTSIESVCFKQYNRMFKVTFIFWKKLVGSEKLNIKCHTIPLTLKVISVKSYI